MEYKRLGNYIREVNVRNRELKITNLLGLSIEKRFIPSIANTIGTAYFDDVTDGKTPTIKLTAEEYEKGVNEFDDGMRKIIEEADELIFRAKLGDLPDVLSFSYILSAFSIIQKVPVRE